MIMIVLFRNPHVKLMCIILYINDMYLHYSIQLCMYCSAVITQSIVENILAGTLMDVRLFCHQMFSVQVHTLY